MFRLELELRLGYSPSTPRETLSRKIGESIVGAVSVSRSQGDSGSVVERLVGLRESDETRSRKVSCESFENMAGFRVSRTKVPA